MYQYEYILSKKNVLARYIWHNSIYTKFLKLINATLCIFWSCKHMYICDKTLHQI